MGGFSNQTMRQPVEGKPHIAYIDKHWRVSPWRRDNAALYYEAHRWTVHRGRRESGEANGHYAVSLEDLHRQLKHGSNNSVSPAWILASIEQLLEKEAKQ